VQGKSRGRAKERKKGSDCSAIFRYIIIQRQTNYKQTNPTNKQKREKILDTIHTTRALAKIIKTIMTTRRRKMIMMIILIMIIIIIIFYSV